MPAVLYEVEDAVATITLNRPEALNAMNPELLTGLVEAVRGAAGDQAVRCVVITGAGRAFCAGGDVKGMAEGRRASGTTTSDAPGDGAARLRDQEEASRLLYEMPKPTIAAINGHAVGAGLSVALSADLRVASDQAKLGTAFARVGLSGDFGGSWLLQRLVGPSRAKELYFTADILTAEQALAERLVTRVVPHESLMAETMAFARRLAAGPTGTFARMKENFAFGATSSFGDLLTKEAENMVASSATEDHRNAARAFVERREPTFTGR